MAKWFPCICRQTAGQIDLKLSGSFISIAKTRRLRKPESYVSHLWTRTHSLFILQMNHWGTKKLCHMPKIILSDLRATTNSFNGCAEFGRVGPGFSAWTSRLITRNWACFGHISMAQHDGSLMYKILGLSAFSKENIFQNIIQIPGNAAEVSQDAFMMNPFGSQLHVPQQQLLMLAYTDIARWDSFWPVMVARVAAGSTVQQSTERSM